jgi:flagellar biosynthetic protein FliP
MTFLRRRPLAALVLAAFIVVSGIGIALAATASRASADPTPAATPAATLAVPLSTTLAPSTTVAGGVAPTPTQLPGFNDPSLQAPTAPSKPTVSAGGGSGSLTVDVGGKPSTSISILLLLTVVSVAPSLLLLMTSFTKIFVVLSITRNALGLTSVPPNQVLAGLSMFISFFVMSPVFTKVNSEGIQPYLSGKKTQNAAFHDGIAPLKTFMLQHTRTDEIALMLRAAKLPNPAHASDVGLGPLIPAFVLSELRSAMIIGFVVYIPFLIIDMVVSSSLMSLGMMMLPPVSVSLPFKLLLFVLVDGWGMVVSSLVTSYNTS